MAECPQLDPGKKDSDEVMLCPIEVKSSMSAWAVFRCAADQATSFHRPTPEEMEAMDALLNAWSEGDSAVLLESADSLGLQVCRTPDSILLLYAKPGVKDYSGPFMMLREKDYSKVLLISGHDDSDATFSDTKAALQSSKAMAVISNGHRRSNVRRGSNPGTNDDFLFSDGPEENLGTYAIRKICDLKKSSVVLVVDGSSEKDAILTTSDQRDLAKAFKNAVYKYSTIRKFGVRNQKLAIDSLVNTDYYMKLALPFTMHYDQPTVIANIVKDLETYDWAKNL